MAGAEAQEGMSVKWGVPQWLNGRKPLGIVACCSLLTAAVLAFYPLVAWGAYSRYGKAGILSAAVAAGVCWLGAILALFAVALFRGPQGGVHGALLGMAFRLGLPLGAGVFLSRQGGSLAEAGIFGLIVIFYLFTLVVEVPLSLSLLSARNAPGNS